MTIRFLTTDGAYKIAEVVDLECDPVTEVNMTVWNGVLHIKESK